MGAGKKTIEIVAEKYGISKNTLQRKMALAYCNEKVVLLYEKKKLTQAQIVMLMRNIRKHQEERQKKMRAILTHN